MAWEQRGLITIDLELIHCERQLRLHATLR